MSSPDFLLLSQKEELFSKIKQAGLDPSGFMWRQSIEDRAKSKATLVHKASKYYFMISIDKVNENFEYKYSPGTEFLETGPKFSNWDWTSTYFTVWLNNLKIQTSIPDVWAMLSKSNELTESIDLINDTDSFTEDEQKRLSQGISEIKQFLIDTNELNSQQLKFIESRLSHLEESSRRLSKKDWTLTAIGILTSIIVQVCLTPDNSREFFLIASTAFSWVQQSYLTLPDF